MMELTKLEMLNLLIKVLCTSQRYMMQAGDRCYLCFMENIPHWADLEVIQQVIMPRDKWSVCIPHSVSLSIWARSLTMTADLTVCWCGHHRLKERGHLSPCHLWCYLVSEWSVGQTVTTGVTNEQSGTIHQLPDLIDTSIRGQVLL